MYKHPTLSPSWPNTVSTKETWNTVRNNPNSTEQQKKTARDNYKKAMWKCLKESL